MSADPRRQIVGNPFYVLGLPVDCTRLEVEREGNKLLGMLEIGLSAARTYQTPLGEHPRTPEAVREAMAELRDPERRLVHELWAQLSPDDGYAAPDARDADAAGWDDALATLGLAGPRGGR